VVSAVCLVLSSTSLWTRRHVVNTDVFVAGGQAILADPAVQGAIDAKVVDTIMANPEVNGAVNDVVALLPPRLQRFKPALEDEARDLLSSGVHAVLTSDRFSLLTEAALRSVQTQLLAGQPVRFTLGQAKARIPQQDRTGLAGEVVNLIPDDVGFTVLTPQQARLLACMADADGRAVNRDTVPAELWRDDDSDADKPRQVNVTIYKLRGKLKAAGFPPLIRTVWGSGYALTVPCKVSHPVRRLTITDATERAIRQLLDTHPNHALADKVHAELGMAV